MKLIQQRIMYQFLKEKMIKKESRFSFVCYVILNLLVIAAMIIVTFKGPKRDVLTCLKVMLLFTTPWIFERKLKVILPKMLVIIIQFYIYAAFILGEMNSFYIRVPIWDSILHILNGFVCAIFGFSLLNQFRQNKNSMTSEKANNEKLIVIKPIYIALFTLCFSMTVGILWEFYEFSIDNLFNRDMQKDTIVHTIKSMKLGYSGYIPNSLTGIEKVTINGQDLGLGGYLDIGLFDTMKDLFNNFIGAMLFCSISFVYCKNGYQGKIVEHLLIRARK